ncbi:MAG TPA: c-type cytochrome [Longimicrobiales bacterium]
MRRVLLVATILLAPLPARAQLSPFQAAKAEALLHTHLPCLGCHRLDGEGGRVGPDLSAVGTRRSAEYIRAMLLDPAGRVPGSIMPRVPLDGARVELLVAYLSGRKGASTSGAEGRAAWGPLRPAPRAPRAGPGGRAPSLIYASYCTPCHGEKGSGHGYNAPYLPDPPGPQTDAELMGKRSDDMLFDVIFVGGYAYGRPARMPPWGQTLSAAEIRGLVGYIRALCRCRGPQWSGGGR